MSTWIVGDIHGCAVELEQLVARLALGPDDRLVSVGDLFHRGPDPAGVLAILEKHAGAFVLGNHELAVLKRVALAPRKLDASDRPKLRESFPELDESDLAGDGGQSCRVPRADRASILRYLQKHSGFYLRSESFSKDALTRDGRAFDVVHAGLTPGVSLERNSIEALTSLRRTRGAGNPWWYESYGGERLVVFGHTPSPLPRAWHVRGKLAALGLDTGCVYGGSLTAYSPEQDEFVSVKAVRTYANAS